MANQLTSNAEALRLFFTEDVFLVKSSLEEALVAPLEQVDRNPVVPNLSNISQGAVPVSNSQAGLATATEEQPSKVWEFAFLGKNQKRILILVNDAENAVSTKEGTELLRNLVKAINLTNNDFALVNYANYMGAKFNDLKLFFNCELVLSFGVGHKHLGLTEQPLHHLFTVHETRFVLASNLHGLHQDNASKKLLWATLQQIK